MLDGFGFAPEVDRGSNAKDLWMREADDACVAGDRTRCICAIERLYKLFDDEKQ